MCGIAGFYDVDGELSRSDLKTMTDALSHRGPDAEGFYFKQPIALGHRRLSIIDLSDAANQPMVSHDDNLRIIFNGEIYNYRELAKELGINFRTTSDTEVLIEAYRMWGHSFVHKLNGMFTMAIWEEKDQSLFLCRDRLGIKPLFYTLNGNFLAFASELKALLTLRNHANFSLNKQAVREYLLLGYIPEPNSICNEIKKFPSGCYALYKQGNLEIKSYWQPEDQIQAEIIKNEQDAKQQLKQLVNNSVRLRMVSDVPFGTFLSGGIDSSLVTAVAQHNADLPINTFSIGFNDVKHNEANYARQIAAYLKTHHFEFMVTEQDALSLIDQMTEAYDEPYADSSAIPTMMVSQLARKHVTMTLSGDGGDELFLGYGAYKWAKRLANPFVKMMKPVFKNTFESLRGDRYKRIAQLFTQVDESLLKQHIFSQEQYFFSEQEINQLFIDAQKIKPFWPPLPVINRKLRPEEQQALFDIRYYLKDDLLTKVDRASMQFSLETRVPLLDYRIVQFALNLSADLKFKNGDSKYLLRQVLFDYVPEKYFDRPKWGFSIPLHKWLKTDLNYLIERYCSKEACERFNLVRYEVVNKYLTEYKNGRNYYYNRIWQIIVLHKSLERLGLSETMH